MSYSWQLKKPSAPTTDDVFRALKEHAKGREKALRPADLARKSAMAPRNVSNALYELVVRERTPGVKRERNSSRPGYKYWWDAEGDT